MELYIFARFHAREGQERAVEETLVDEAAFENHIRLPHTLKMVSTMEPLIDHPLDVTRTEQLV